jgi:hypothetical protein
MPLLLVPAGPARCMPGAQNGGQRRAAAERVSHRKPRLTRADGAGPRRHKQLTTTLLNRGTTSDLPETATL